VDGALALRGALAHPALDGEVTLTNARLAGRPLDDSRVQVHALRDRLAFEGAVGPSIAFDGRLQGAAAGTQPGGTANVRLRNLRLGPWLPAPWAALNVSASGEVTASVAEPSPPEVRGSLHLDSTAGALQVNGHVEGAALALALNGQLDAAALAAPLRRIGRPNGRVDVAAKISGTIAEPAVEGELRVDAKLRPVRRSLPELHVAGRVKAHGQTLSTRDLRVDVANLGTFTVGRLDQPASVEIGPLWPPGPWRVDVPLAAHRLAFKQPTSAISIDGLDVDLRLQGQTGGDLFLRGEVDLTHAAYNLSGPAAKLPPEPKPASPPSHHPWYESLPPHLTVDLTLRGPHHAMTVEIPYAPDVTVELECHLFATSRGATLSGYLRGDGSFSRAAVAVFDWLEPEHIRSCQLLSL
jgi:hypothetical protein